MGQFILFCLGGDPTNLQGLMNDVFFRSNFRWCITFCLFSERGTNIT
jgi:hypothetical protein